MAQLLAMLDEKDTNVQAQGALGLSLAADKATEAVPRLIALLESSDSLVRRQSSLALGKIGPGARSAVPPLVRLLTHEDWATRRQAALALGEIGDASARAGLEKRKNDPNTLTQRAVRDALLKLGKDKP